MFERFSAPARATVVAAQAEATAMGSDAIGCEHLLVAAVAAPDSAAARAAHEAGARADTLRAAVADLTRSGPALDADALAAIGIDLDEVRRRVERSFGPGALERRRPRRAGHVPLSPAAKHAFERALRTAIARGDRQIGAEHLLLGVLDAMEPAGPAARALQRVGVDPARLRELLAPARSA
jgi:ATP-dependent Clp protease ATP-binding subunit ClpA